MISPLAAYAHCLHLALAPNPASGFAFHFDRITSARTATPSNKHIAASPAVTFHCAVFIPVFNTSEAHVFAFVSCSSSRKIVGVFSTILRKRNHACSVELAAPFSARCRSRPVPPFQNRPCSSRIRRAQGLVDVLAAQPHKILFSSTPAASAECGSKASRLSTRAQASGCRVRPAKAASSRLVCLSREARKFPREPPRGNPLPVHRSRGFLRQRCPGSGDRKS